MNKRKAMAVALILSMLVSTNTSFATSQKSLQDSLRKNQQKQNDIKQQIKQIDKKSNDLIAQIQQLNKEINEAEEEINNLQEQITDKQGEINNTIVELQEAEKNIDDKQDILGSRLNVMYRNSNIGYAEVLLSSRSFSELMSNLDMIKKIVNHDVDLLKYMEEQRNTIEDKKIQLEKQKIQLVNLKNNVDSRRKTLVVSRSQQEGLRKEMAADKVALEKMEDTLQKEADELTNKLRSMSSSNSQYVGGQLQWPLSGYTSISSPFGNRIHPILKTKKFHSGIDIPAPKGVAVSAAGAGKVIHSGNLGGYGKAVIIDHGGGIMTLYAHNSKLIVAEGASVARGQKIAEVGSTGMSTGNHLHFEVRKDGKYVDPIPYVKGK